MGAAALRDDAYFKEISAKTIATRERMKKELKRLGFRFGDSKTNFVFASHERLSASEIFQYLREKQIYVRHWNKARIDNYLRISVGTEKETDCLIKALEELIKC